MFLLRTFALLWKIKPRETEHEKGCDDSSTLWDWAEFWTKLNVLVSDVFKTIVYNSFHLVVLVYAVLVLQVFLHYLYITSSTFIPILIPLHQWLPLQPIATLYCYSTIVSWSEDAHSIYRVWFEVLGPVAEVYNFSTLLKNWNHLIDCNYF